MKKYIFGMHGKSFLNSFYCRILDTKKVKFFVECFRHDAMSKEVPPCLYQTFVTYQNEMAQANGIS